MPLLFSADQKLAFRLAPFYVALFLIVGLQLPFWPVWLAFKGLTVEQIGIVLSAPIWAKIVFTPIIASMADHFGRRRMPLVIMSAICLGIFQFYFVADGFWQILAISSSIGILYSSFSALGDNLVLTLSRSYKIDYPRIRLWGSISFIVAAFWGGQMLTGRSPDFIPVMLAVGFLLLFLCCLLLPEIKVLQSESGRRGMRRLLKNPGFVAFMMTAGLIQASHAVLYSSGTLQWRSQGISDQVIGFLWAEGVIVEIILFAFARYFFRSFSPVQLLLIGALAGLARWSIMGFTPGVPLLVFIQALHGITFAAAHLGAMRFIVEKIPVEISARAQGLYSAVSLGLIMGGGLFISGYLYEVFAAGSYFFMAGACFIALVISWFLARLPEIALH
ncbi:MAG: MFS transporter [Sneathiella sp.]|nr:MFS transporter [Sneathiella sp.]